MSDDLVPEEGAQEYHQLLTVLRSSSQRRVPIAAGEQMQILARVRERFAQAMSSSTLPNVGAFTPERSFIAHVPARQTRKSTRFVANLLVALVVIGLILGSWALFRVYPFSHGASVSTSVPEQGPVTHAQADGLETSMHVLIGVPYFLSELLPIDVSLTNHTQRPAELDGTIRIVSNSIADPCFPSALLVHVTKGDNPSYTFPQFGFGCLQPLYVTEVAPGQTITIHQYVPLTKSREVTLTTGMVPPDGTADPFNGRWPTVDMQVQVNPQVPQDRALSLQNRERQAMITIPAGAKAHLLSIQTITCDNYSDGSGQWAPLSTNVLDEPTCPTSHPHWSYIVSAPGYSIVSGSQAA